MLKISMFGQQKGESHIPVHQHRKRFFQILCCLFSIRTSWVVLLGAIAVAMVCLSHFLSIAVQRNSHTYLGGGFNFFLNFHPYLGTFPILTHIFQLFLETTSHVTFVTFPRMIHASFPIRMELRLRVIVLMHHLEIGQRLEAQRFSNGNRGL